MDGKGLYGKYRISRADGTPLRDSDRLFVLNYGIGDDNQAHDPIARAALARYATLVATTNPTLADELWAALDHPLSAHSHEVDDDPLV